MECVAETTLYNVIQFHRSLVESELYPKPLALWLRICCNGQIEFCHLEQNGEDQYLQLDVSKVFPTSGMNTDGTESLKKSAGISSAYPHIAEWQLLCVGYSRLKNGTSDVDTTAFRRWVDWALCDGIFHLRIKIIKISNDETFDESVAMEQTVENEKAIRKRIVESSGVGMARSDQSSRLNLSHEDNCHTAVTNCYKIIDALAFGEFPVATEESPCHFEHWYHHLDDVCPYTTFIAVPQQFQRWLTDGNGICDILYSDSEVSSCDESDDEPTGHFIPPQNSKNIDRSVYQFHSDPACRDFVQKVEDRLLSQWSKGVVPKLNGRCPFDAAWMTGGLECFSFNDICLLLKASSECCDLAADAVRSVDGSDHTAGAKHEPSITLALQDYHCLKLALQLRLFLVDGRLIAYASKYIDDYANFYCDSPSRPEIESTLMDIVGRIDRGLKSAAITSIPVRHLLPYTVADVAVTQTDSYGRWSRAWLLNLDPWSHKSTPSPFTWEELASIAYGQPRPNDGPHPLRWKAVTEECAPLPKAAVPQDLIEMKDENKHMLATLLQAVECNDQRSPTV